MLMLKRNLQELCQRTAQEQNATAVPDFTGEGGLAKLRQLDAEMLVALTIPGGLVEAALFLADRGARSVQDEVLHQSWHEKALHREGLSVASELISKGGEKKEILLLEVRDRGVPVMIYRRSVYRNVAHQEGSLYLGFSDWAHRLRASAQALVQAPVSQTEEDPRQTICQHQQARRLAAGADASKK